MHTNPFARAAPRRSWRYVLAALVGAACAFCSAAAYAEANAAREQHVAILAYHRFDRSAAVDSMTVRVATFDAQLRFLRERGYRIVSLRDVVNWLLSPQDTAMPDKAVAFTADDGHRSVYEVLMPIALREHVPFTLFVYPSAISNASYALSWTQLETLQRTGLFEVQSHTYWHPNFNVERMNRTREDFRRFATKQLVDSRTRIEARLSTRVDLLAWPFGIVDPELIEIASALGYRAAFTIEGRTVDRHASPLAVSRLLVTDADSPAVLARRLGEAEPNNH